MSEPPTRVDEGDCELKRQPFFEHVTSESDVFKITFFFNRNNLYAPIVIPLMAQFQVSVFIITISFLPSGNWRNKLST